jgi:dipeptidyl-peptidase-4
MRRAIRIGRVRNGAALLVALAAAGTVVTTSSLAGQAGSPAAVQEVVPERLKQIFDSRDFTIRSFGPARWLDAGDAYTTLEPSGSTEGARDIVRYDTASGRREVLVDAARLVPAGATSALDIADYAWSSDRRRLLIFTNTRRVWRQNTRGDYWVLDVEADGGLRQLGGHADEATLMFAKLSPDATRAAYVRAHDLFVEDIATGTITRLTHDGSDTRINGTSDWVYEEEFGVRDGFRWSPDGRRLAFWSFDASGIEPFSLIDNTGALYPTITQIPYPKAGTINSAVRIGVVEAAGGETRWMRVPGDPRDTYIARMDWAADSDSLVLQHLNRLQNENEVLLADATSGAVRRVHRDESTSWVDVVDDLAWLDGGREFLWVSEKDGWRHAYGVDRNGGGDRLITRFDADITEVVGTDAAERWLYVIASPDDATQRYLYRAPLDGSEAPERLTPSDQPGTHSYRLSPDGRWAFHTYSRFEMPPRIELVRLPEHHAVRVLEDNAALASTVASWLSPPAEFFKVAVDAGIVLDGWMIKPRDFDPARRYPLLMYVYGEPAGQTVVDQWGGANLLYHRVLADAGFIVASVDNRGTPAPRGAAWRKVVYGAIGDLSSKEQAAAVRALVARHSFIDADRVAIWGWSGGGSTTLNCLFRFPDVFKLGIAVAPVPDQALYDTIYQERYMGLPADNADGYALGSPITFADGLAGRLLLIHGTGDDNVHYQGTERLVNALVAANKPFQMMVYPNRTHSISEGPGTSRHLYELLTRYLTEHLPPKRP